MGFMRSISKLVLEASKFGSSFVHCNSTRFNKAFLVKKRHTASEYVKKVQTHPTD